MSLGVSKGIGEVANYKPLARCGMEELAARQRSITPSGGVLFARNTDREEKAAARQLVLDLFHPDRWGPSLRILTMPSVHWRFERKLLAMRQPGWMRDAKPRGTYFTGVENDRSIFFAAVAQMPGLHTPRAVVKQVKNNYPFAEMGIKTNYGSFFFANVDDFVTHEWDGGWEAAWLDFTGPLTAVRLRKIKRFYERHVSGVLIVTALKARWHKDDSEAIKKAGGHTEWVRRYLDGEVLHDLEYCDTAPMVQVALRKPVQQEGK
jgi:hypothetical protein